MEGKDTSPPHVERPINLEESTLVFKTRLRTTPQKMAENFLRDWQTINNVEYRENKTGNERIVVTEDLESRVSGLGESVKGALRLVGLPSVRTNGIGAGVTSFTELRVDVINVGGANDLSTLHLVYLTTGRPRADL